MEGLEEFSSLSGLIPNPSKSNMYFSGCNNNLREDLLRVAKFIEGTLPVKYLGVPLTTTKFNASDCQQLIDKMMPESKVIKEIDSLLRAFLWSGTELKYHSAKISWDKVCALKSEGGLGFKSLGVNASGDLKFLMINLGFGGRFHLLDLSFTL
ncbi:uncharacterized protein LOC114304820 [Camellia sinensis]|uniref:uncharacterized protein LOC114304820 n=1 Tax=Camellia sinensis TaxID=4442 RepID=UPI0010356BA1|nr:uncharacterized protein LOC114304820 [Camellia sinensis]